jgi:phosphatidylglycerophosphatase A
MTAIALFLASFGYSGYAPVAPGTAGSAAALAAYAGLRWFDLTRFETFFIPLVFAIGVWAASVTARHVGRSDPGIVVIDEVVGMLITLAFLNVGFLGGFIGFLLFRIFDVVKPFPAAQSERLPGGLGIMVDDVVAGVYAQLVLRALTWAWPAWMLQS